MIKQKRLAILGVFVCFFTLVIASESQARRSGKRPEKSIEQRVQDCLDNKSGLEVSVKSILNSKSNPRAENVAKADWQKYCSCLVPKSKEIEDTYPPGNLPKQEYQKRTEQFTAVLVECANMSIPVGKPETPTVAKMKPDSRFEATLNNCKTRPKGYLKNLEIHLKVQNSPRAEKVQSMDVGKYCDCYVNSLRAKLGDDRAHKMLTTFPKNTPEETMLIAKAKDDTFDFCAAEQIPFN